MKATGYVVRSNIEESGRSTEIRGGPDMKAAGYPAEPNIEESRLYRS